MTVLVKPLQARYLELEDQGKLDLATVARELGYVDKKGTLRKDEVRRVLGFYRAHKPPQVTVTDVTAERLNAIFEAAV